MMAAGTLRSTSGSPTRVALVLSAVALVVGRAASIVGAHDVQVGDLAVVVGARDLSGTFWPSAHGLEREASPFVAALLAPVVGLRDVDPLADLDMVRIVGLVVIGAAVATISGIWQRLGEQRVGRPLLVATTFAAPGIGIAVGHGRGVAVALAAVVMAHAILVDDSRARTVGRIAAGVAVASSWLALPAVVLLHFAASERFGAPGPGFSGWSRRALPTGVPVLVGLAVGLARGSPNASLGLAPHDSAAGPVAWISSVALLPLLAATIVFVGADGFPPKRRIGRLTGLGVVMIGLALMARADHTSAWGPGDGPLPWSEGGIPALVGSGALLVVAVLALTVVERGEQRSLVLVWSAAGATAVLALVMGTGELEALALWEMHSVVLVCRAATGRRASKAPGSMAWGRGAAAFSTGVFILAGLVATGIGAVRDDDAMVRLQALTRAHGIDVDSLVLVGRVGAANAILGGRVVEEEGQALAKWVVVSTRDLAGPLRGKAEAVAEIDRLVRAGSRFRGSTDGRTSGEYVLYRWFGSLPDTPPAGDPLPISNGIDIFW